MSEFIINFDVCKYLDSGPFFVEEESIIVQGLQEFDQIYFKINENFDYQAFSTREIYPSWKQDLFFFLGNTGTPADSSRAVMVGPSIDRVEVTKIDPRGIWVWHKDFQYAVVKPAVTPKDLLAQGRCPRCGVEGRFVGMALCCPTHGAYAGI